MDMRSLNRSLPPTTALVKPSEAVLQAFKDAALSVTKLYKEAVSSQGKARQAGYQDALDDLLSFLDKENLGLGDGEGWTVRQWATERLDDGAAGRGSVAGGGTAATAAGSDSDDEHDTTTEKQDERPIETNTNNNDSTTNNNSASVNHAKEEQRLSPSGPDLSATTHAPAHAHAHPDNSTRQHHQRQDTVALLSSSPPPPLLKSSPAFTFRAASNPYPLSTPSAIIDVDMQSSQDTTLTPQLSLTATSTPSSGPDSQLTPSSVRIRSTRPPRHHRNSRSTSSVLRSSHEIGMNLAPGGGTGTKRKLGSGDYFDLGEWKDLFGGAGGGGNGGNGSNGGLGGGGGGGGGQNGSAKRGRLG